MIPGGVDERGAAVRADFEYGLIDGQIFAVAASCHPAKRKEETKEGRKKQIKTDTATKKTESELIILSSLYLLSETEWNRIYK